MILVDGGPLIVKGVVDGIGYAQRGIRVAIPQTEPKTERRGD